MPRVPYFTGSPASQTQVAGFVPAQPDYEQFAREAASGLSPIFARIFKNPQTDPATQLARQRAAAASVDEQKVAEVKAADAARGGVSSTLDEIAYRDGRGTPTGPGMGTAPVQIAEDAPYLGPQGALAPSRSPEEDAAAVRGLAATALQRGIGAGGDPKKLSPILQSFLLSAGDDAGIVRANAALEGQYLGKGDSPSLGRQDQLREEDFQHDSEKQAAELRLKKYGFEQEHQDRVLNITTDATTARRGQDIGAGTSRRGQDIEHGDRTRGQNLEDARAGRTANLPTVTTTEELPARDAQPAQSKFMGIFGADKPAAPARNKTVVTTKRVVGAGSGRPPISAFGH